MNRPMIIAVGGYPGSGKSTLAYELGIRLKAPVLSCDVIRKRLVGVPPTHRLGDPYYTKDWNAKVYGQMFQTAHLLVKCGLDVVCDSTWLAATRRYQIKYHAAHAGADFRGLWLNAHEDVAAKRIAGRNGGASDVTKDSMYIVDRMRSEGVGGLTEGWEIIDAGGHLATAVTNAWRAITANG